MPHLDPWCDALCVYWVLGKGEILAPVAPPRLASSCKRALRGQDHELGVTWPQGSCSIPSQVPCWALPAHSLSPMMSLAQSSHTRWLRLFSFSSCSILRGSAGGSRPWRSNNGSNSSQIGQICLSVFISIDGSLPDSDTEVGQGRHWSFSKCSTGHGEKCSAPNEFLLLQGNAKAGHVNSQGKALCPGRGPGDHREGSDCCWVKPLLPSTWMKLSTISRAGFSTSSSHLCRSDTSKP